MYASSEYAITDKSLAEEPKPELGVYLDSRWMERLTGFAAVGIQSPVTWEWPFVIADWPDMGVMAPADHEILMKWLVKHIKSGIRVEIACLGGHGRTGTVLAMLRVVLGGMTAEEAITSVREDYCNKTVESVRQIDAVYEYAGEPIPKNSPVKPSKMVATYSYTVLCADCLHSEYPHERAARDFDTVGCAFAKFNDKDPWTCACKGFVEDITADAAKDEVSKDEVSKDGSSLAEWLDNLDRQESGYTDNVDFIEPEPHDLCYCLCSFKRHEDEGKCADCGCPEFELYEIVTTGKGEGTRRLN